MAITFPQHSEQYQTLTGSPGPVYPVGLLHPAEPVDSSDWGSRLRVSYAKLTITGAGFTTAAAGDLKLIKLPAGKVRIHLGLSYVACPQGAATSDLDIGLGGYVNAAGAPVALQGAYLAGSLDVGGAAIRQNLISGSDVTTVIAREINSQAGVDVVCSFDTANSPLGDLELAIAFQMGN